ncbi:MAG: ABC transporter permease, partial [Acidobacteriia bacterium]|nr:ABC transporter permease [Terriglobia bacterium]
LDARHAGRGLVKSPGFTAVAVLSLAFGIGANTALFSLMDVMLLRKLPVRNPQELVGFVRADPNSMMTNLPYSVFQYFRHDRDALSAVFAIAQATRVFQGGGPPERTRAHEVSGLFFPALGVSAMLGRALGPDDDRPGAANRVAALSYAFWARRFGRDPSIVGKAVRLSGELFTVVGVMPPDFFGVDRSRVPDLWIPLGLEPEPGEVWVLGRLNPGVSIPQAHARLEPLFREALESLRSQFASERERNAFLAQRLIVNRAGQGAPDVRWTYWDYSSTLKILLGLTGLVLLIACVNLANLLMARSAARSREIGIRIAIGAGRGRVVRQLLTENVLLSLAGGALGVLIAAWGHRLLLGFLVRDPQTVALDFRLDYRVLGFGLALSLATALLFGLAPAIRVTRADPAAAIHGGGRSGLNKVPLARTLLAAQVSFSMVLLVGAGLFARSLGNLGAADLGLEKQNLVLMDIRPSVKAPGQRRQFWTQLLERARALPGVRGAAFAGDAVFGNGGWNQTVWMERAGEPPVDAHVNVNFVSPGFFATAGIPVRMGREFGERDREGMPLVALVNETFARRFFGSGNPIGKHFGDRGPASTGLYEIVGVVGDAKYGNVREQANPMVFHAALQAAPRSSFVLHVRAAADAGALAPPVVRAAAVMDPEALVSNVRTLPQVIREQLRQDRMFATLAGFFALLALALGAIGIYGVAAYRAARRTAEIGVRVALGARRANVLWLILRESLALLAAGVAIGLPTALVAARFIKSLLFALEPSDPVTFAGAAVTLFACGGLAGLLPALRAASVEPVIALREE